MEKLVKGDTGMPTEKETGAEKQEQIIMETERGRQTD